MKNGLQKDVDYYLVDGLIIMTEEFHKKRGFCCGNGCRHCCFLPKHTKGSIHIESKYAENNINLNFKDFKKI